MKKIIVLLTVFALLLAMIPTANAKKITIDLLQCAAGTENWNVINGVWSGTLQNTNGIIEPAERAYVNGSLVIRSTSTKQDVADIWLGNYVGIGNLVSPNTTYTLTVTLKFNSNASHPLHRDYPDDGASLLIDALEFGKGSLGEASYSQNAVVVNDTEGQFKTYTVTFTTPANVSNAIVQVGPYGVGGNWYWGGFTPGASVEIKTCKLETTVSDPGAIKRIELVNKEAGTESWDIVEGVWSGTLQSGAGELAGVPCIREKTPSGALRVASESTSNVNTADHGVGNYIGIAGYLKPNTEYTLTSKVKFTINKNHVLAGTHQVYAGIVFDCVKVGADSLNNGTLSGQAVLIEDTDGQFVTNTIKFKTPATIDPNTVVVLGPSNYVFGSNYYWGSFLPGNEIIIESCILEGDLVEGTEDPSPDTGDMTASVVCISAVLAAGAAFVFRKKH